MREKLAAFILYIFPDFPERIENGWIAFRITREKTLRKMGWWPTQSDAR